MGRESGRSRKYLHICIACLILLSSFGCATLREIVREGRAREDLRAAVARLSERDFKGAAEANAGVLEMYPDRPPGDEAAYNLGIIAAHHANPEKDGKKALQYFTQVIRDFPQGARTEEAKVWAGALYLCEECKDQLVDRTRQLDETKSGLRDREREAEELRARIEELEGAIEEAKSKQEDRMSADSQMSRARRFIALRNFEGALEEQQRVLSRHPNRPPGDEALFAMGLVFANPDNPKKDYRRALELFRRVVSQFPQSPRVEEAKVWAGILDVIEQTKQVDIEIEQKKKEMAR